jgi:hypothetical protein
MSKLMVASLVALVPVMAYTQNNESFQCTHASLTRRVEIVYESGQLPCQVRYYKGTETPGASQVLWSAQNEVGYCEARAREFVEQLRGWGWDCEVTATPPAADDTAVLGAGEGQAPQ